MSQNLPFSYGQFRRRCKWHLLANHVIVNVDRNGWLAPLWVFASLVSFCCHSCNKKNTTVESISLLGIGSQLLNNTADMYVKRYVFYTSCREIVRVYRNRWVLCLVNVKCANLLVITTSSVPSGLYNSNLCFTVTFEKNPHVRSLFF